MSFDYNPYKHIEVIQSDEDPNVWYAHCHGCGGDIASRSDSDSLRIFVEDLRKHIRKSHGRDEEDFATWSKH